MKTGNILLVFLGNLLILLLSGCSGSSTLEGGYSINVESESRSPSSLLPGSQPYSTASFIPSADGSTIPPASSLTDGSGNIWTVAGGVIYENGALAGFSDAVILLLFHGNVIYQENIHDDWWAWVNGNWIAVSPPN